MSNLGLRKQKSSKVKQQIKLIIKYNLNKIQYNLNIM